MQFLLISFFAVDRKSGKGGKAPAGRAKELYFLLSGVPGSAIENTIGEE